MKWHPDKWVTADPAQKALAGQKMAMVIKAYEALTDPVAMKNWKEFGNLMDARHSLFHWPSFILNREGQSRNRS